MADGAAPLLPSFSGDTTKKKPSFNNNINNAIELYMDSAAGSTHLFLPTLAAFAWFFDAHQAFISIFSDATPPWPNQSSPLLLALPTSSFFFGCFLGGLLLATIADSQLGRKKTLFLTALLMSITSALTAFSPNLTAYSALRFVSGFSRANVGTSAFVLSSELSPRRHRDFIGVLNFFFYTIGFLSLPAIAFLNKSSSWRFLYLYTAFPCFLYSITIYFVLKESPRWLLVKGRTEEAIQTLQNLTFIKQSFSDLTEIEITATENDAFSAARILCGKRWAVRRLAAISAASFGVGMVYYGMPLSLGNLSADLYLSTALNAAAELPSSLAAFLIARRAKRRPAIVAFTAFSGLCSAACAAMAGGGWMEMAAELGSFFAACTAFNVMIMYGVELFPTCVRNSALAVVRQVVVAGGAVAPVIVAAGRRSRLMSFGVFGIAVFTAGLFAGFLPETKGRGISDTMEEEENKEFAARNSCT